MTDNICMMQSISHHSTLQHQLHKRRATTTVTRNTCHHLICVNIPLQNTYARTCPCRHTRKHRHDTIPQPTPMPMLISHSSFPVFILFQPQTGKTPCRAHTKRQLSCQQTPSDSFLVSRHQTTAFLSADTKRQLSCRATHASVALAVLCVPIPSFFLS